MPGCEMQTHYYTKWADTNPQNWYSSHKKRNIRSGDLVYNPLIHTLRHWPKDRTSSVKGSVLAVLPVAAFVFEKRKQRKTRKKKRTLFCSLWCPLLCWFCVVVAFCGCFVFGFSWARGTFIRGNHFVFSYVFLNVTLVILLLGLSMCFFPCSCVDIFGLRKIGFVTVSILRAMWLFWIRLETWLRDGNLILASLVHRGAISLNFLRASLSPVPLFPTLLLPVPLSNHHDWTGNYQDCYCKHHWRLCACTDCGPCGRQF